jgi:hypothetical protein
MVDSVPALAASRLYLYLSKGADDLTMTLWSTLATTQLQIFAAHACTNGFVITKRMSSVVSHFGLANQALPSGPTEAHHARTTMSSRKSVHQRMSVSDRFLPRGDEAMGTIQGDGESQRGILCTVEYAVKHDNQGGEVEEASQTACDESSAWAAETALSSGRW